MARHRRHERYREGLQRIIDDLSSYYLLGYYSTGKLDGRFHSIRGPREACRASRCARGAGIWRRARPMSPAACRRPPRRRRAGAEAAIATAAAAAVATMPAAARDLPLRVHVTAGWRPGGDGSAGSRRRCSGRSRGGRSHSRAAISKPLLTRRGEIVGRRRGRIAPGAISLLMPIVAPGRLEAGDYTVRVRSQTPSGIETLSMPVTLPPPSSRRQVRSSSGAARHRATKILPTADLRFRRSERLRVEVPSAADVAAARLLDRTGKPLAVPVAAATRTTPTARGGRRAELAPRAAGASRLCGRDVRRFRGTRDDRPRFESVKFQDKSTLTRDCPTEPRPDRS